LLVTVVLPFCDLRRIRAAGFDVLPRPRWPDPPDGHLRGIGVVRLRLLSGFESWVGENSLVCGLPSMAIELPRRIGGTNVRLVRKACYFDGLVNGRFEFLFRIHPEPERFDQVASVARALLQRPVRISRSWSDGRGRPLGRQTAAVSRMWAEATVKRGNDSSVALVRSGRAFAVAESSAALAPVPPGSPAGVRLDIDQAGKPFELFTIYAPAGVNTGNGSAYRSCSRTMRTYLLRMLQDVEALSQICSISAAELDADGVQEVFNEYTRHVLRSRTKVENRADLSAYCYAAFARLYPGRIEGLRRELAASRMRPNVRRKLLSFLDDVERAQVHVSQHFNVERIEHMGDKYGDISVSGSTSTAIGRGASATVKDSFNRSVDPDVVAALRDLAGRVRQSGNEEAATDAEMIETAAKKAEQGDEKGAVSLLKRVGTWALGIGTTVGSTALTGFLKTHGIG
jgi:hypothetical protein